MTPPEEHPLYEAILKMVLWGEDREAVFDRLRVNGIDDTEAEALYQAARRERVATFRDEFKKRIGLGLLLMVGGASVFSVFWFGLNLLPRLVLMACGAAIGMGLWKLTSGLVGYLTAESRQGSVADDF